MLEAASEEYYDVISAKLSDREVIKDESEVDVETFKKHGVYDKRPIKVCWESTGRSPVGVKCVEVNKDDKESPKYRCRSAAKEN